MLSQSLLDVLRAVVITKQTVRDMQATQEITPDAARGLLNALNNIDDQVSEIINEADHIYVTGERVDTETLVKSAGF